jgi:DNA-nicking Smr family endonuclease
LRHTPEQIHNFIDLIGYTQKEALEITDRRIAITLESLQRGEIEPNLGNNRDHIYKIIAHKGKHSKNGAGVLKLAISDYLERNGFEHHKDMEHGVFLVRLQAN